MEIATSLQRVEREGYSIELWVPDAQQVQQNYYAQKAVVPATPFPHWTRLWPASLALTDFLFHHTEYINNKNVLELAAGLGLPSLLAARYAQTVYCSDYLPEATSVIQQSAAYLTLPNFQCGVLNWHELPEYLTADVLLLSDVNYEPVEFEQLYTIFSRFLQNGTTIILTTPQRLMAKPFIERLLPWCQLHETAFIPASDGEQAISVLVLKWAFPPFQTQPAR